MRTSMTISIAALLAASALHAQAVVDPGMSRAQVVAKLGKPNVERAADSSVFLFYRNGVERRVGMSDVVVLVGDKVVDAVFRSNGRRYSGASSSPSPIPSDVARKRKPPAVAKP